MSFILDALKKSETERQRADAPALYEMKMAPPRRGVATWLIVLAALLVINIVVLSVVLLRGSHGAAQQTDTNQLPPPAPAPAAAAAPQAQAPQVAAYVGAAPTPPLTAPPPQPSVQAAPPPAVPLPAPDQAASDGAAAAAPSAGLNRQTDDDAPAVEAPRRAAATGGNSTNVRATGGNSGELPTYQQAASAAGANLPELTLNLHAYASNPADRFIFLNMVRLKEGQSTPQGVRVESITPDGAVLSWQGQSFFLQRQ